MTEAQPSEWQQKITGEWYGAPSVFDALGTHQGYEKVARASVFEDGKTVYWMKTELEGGGPLRPRFELGAQFEFAVQDSDAHRIYQGPDFYGAGEPFGMLVDAHYYSPAWQADLRTMVHILDDGETQVYSSLLYDGPTICAVFNGVYKVAFDYATNAVTRQRIDDFTALEKSRGPRPHVAPTKSSGRWSGSMKVYDSQQNEIGKNDVVIHHKPIDLLRAEQTVEISGTFDRTYTVVRERQGNRHTFHGPDVWGNSHAYGRANYISQHFTNEWIKCKGREFLLDPETLDMSVAWQFAEGENLKWTTYGLLTWEVDA